METNDFLLYNEVLYRLHACRTMEELKPTLLGQLKLMIPYTYASFLSIQVDGASILDFLRRAACFLIFLQQRYEWRLDP